MKKVVVFVLLMMSIGSLKAQWSVTPEVGVTATQRAENMNDEWRGGWKLGVGIEYVLNELNEHFSLKSGLYYMQRGSSYNYWYGQYPTYDYMGDYSYPNYSSYLSGRTNNHFLQVPIMTKYSWNLTEDVKITVATGPYIAFNIGNDWEWSSFSNISYGDNNYQGGYGYGYGYNYEGRYEAGRVRSFDWGFSSSVGIEIKNWVANCGYDVSLTKESWWNEARPNYRTFSLSVGYKFKLGK
jgi:hypothetical protein